MECVTFHATELLGQDERLFLTEPCCSPTPDVSRPRLIPDASFLEADRREIALWRGRHNRLGFAYPGAFVCGLGRWKNVIHYGEIKIGPGQLKMRDPYSVLLHTPRVQRGSPGRQIGGIHELHG